ncbi:MAG: DUF4959 domain-containing protein [Bacteroidales bacterium]|nr:DUF4959 domain-containing protein [Bacteroidales bacterium]
MKARYKAIALGLLALGLAVAPCLTSCSDDDTTTLAAVTEVSYIPTSGGAIITFKAPLDNNLLYVKAEYTNSLGEEVYNVVSIYDNKIEIEGLADESKSYEVRLIAVDKNGGESPITTIMVTPGRSYINVIKDNLNIETLLGGIEITWENTSGKPVYVTLIYKPADDPNAEETYYYFQSKNERVKERLRGITPGHYTMSYIVEDLSGNKTEAVTLPDGVDIKEEMMIPKYIDNADDSRTYIWTLVADQTTLINTTNLWNWCPSACDGKNEYVFDGIINSNSDYSTRSNFTSVYKWDGGYGKPFPFDTDEMDIVIDMGHTYIVSRIKAWTRAHWWGWQDYAWIWDDSSYLSWDMAYYNSNALKTFRIYGSLDGVNYKVINECEIADPTYKTYDDYGSDGTAWYEKSSDGGLHTVTRPSDEDYERAQEGFEWDLSSLSDPVRYIRIRYVNAFGSNPDFLNGLSELTLYGALDEDE